jgi:hypothetical protein
MLSNKIYNPNRKAFAKRWMEEQTDRRNMATLTGSHSM